jgi:hypothetical protein
VHDEEVAEGATFEFAHLESTFDLSYDVSLWLECASHFFHVHFFRDEHHILATATECMKLRRFAPLSDHNDEGNYNDIKGPLQVLKWMKKGGEHDVPDIGVVFGEEMFLSRNMEKDVMDFYNGCADPIRACHMWQYKAACGWSPTSSLGHNYSKRCLDYTPSTFFKPGVLVGLQPLHPQNMQRGRSGKNVQIHCSTSRLRERLIHGEVC